jgi:hypothetical protein
VIVVVLVAVLRGSDHHHDGCLLLLFLLDSRFLRMCEPLAEQAVFFFIRVRIDLRQTRA